MGSIQDHSDYSVQQQSNLYTASSGLWYQQLMASCMVWLQASKLQEMVSLVWPDQPKHRHSRGLLVDLVTPDLQGQFYGILPPKAGLCLSWIPTLLLRARFVGTTCEMYDVIQKCLAAVTNDNITSRCCNRWSRFSLAGGSIWQWELKEEMIKSSFSVGSLTALTWKFSLASNSEVCLAMTRKPFLLLKLETSAWTLVLQEHKVFDQDQIMLR